MDRNLVLASVKLLAPNIRDFEFNAAIQSCLDEINVDGFYGKVDITIAGTATGTPETRTDGTYNYWSVQKALIIPSNIIEIEQIYNGTTELLLTTKDNLQRGSMPTNSYFATDTGEIYLSADLKDGDVISFYGEIRVTNLVQLPDYWLPYFENGVLAYYFTNYEKDKAKQDRYDLKQTQAYLVAKDRGGQVFTKPNFKNNPLKR